MARIKVTIEQFEAITPAERQAMPLEESSSLWSQVMARDMEEFERRDRPGEPTTPIA